MATLIEAALRVCREITNVRYGVATNGSTTTLEDDYLQEYPGQFDNGVLWLLSGDNAGSWRNVLTYQNGVVEFLESLSDPILAGDRYAIVEDDVDISLLTQAVNAACKSVGKILQKDDTLVIVSGQEEYTIPAGVSDIRRVEEATNSTTPFTWVVNVNWQEKYGKLIFDADFLPETVGNKLRLSYAGEHPDIYDTDEVQWDVENILWEAILFILRRWNVLTGKDKDWLAEQVSKAEIANVSALRKVKRPPMRDNYMASPY